MRNFLQRIINNDRPALMNAGVFAFLGMVGVLLLFFPFVVLAVSQNSSALDDAADVVYQHRSDLYRALDSLLTYLPFCTFGCLCEMIRRSKYGKKNKIPKEKTASELWQVEIAGCISLGIDIVIRILLLFV